MYKWVALIIASGALASFTASARAETAPDCSQLLRLHADELAGGFARVGVLLAPPERQRAAALAAPASSCSTSTTTGTACSTG